MTPTPNSTSSPPADISLSARAPDRSATASDATAPDLDPARIPRHIAIIMDGNGRWAQRRGSPRLFGHAQGVEAVRRTLRGCTRAGVEALTLYSFSSENWKRPRDEIEGLMTLYQENLNKAKQELIEQNIRFRQIGRRHGVPAAVLDAVDTVTEATSHCTGPCLTLAINYGGRAEIIDAIRAISSEVASGALAPEDITDKHLERHLYTAGLPEPDLLIRTAGEQRISNFLLWQISYAEMYVTDVLWPDFGEEDLFTAIRDYAKRDRRFGALPTRADSSSLR